MYGPFIASCLLRQGVLARFEHGREAGQVLQARTARANLPVASNRILGAFRSLTSAGGPEVHCKLGVE